MVDLSDGFFDVPPGKLAMVVTHLEMCAPPTLRGVPAPQGVTFADLPRLVVPYRALFRRVGQDWLWFGRLELSDDELSAILTDPNVLLFTLIKDGKPEAILELDFREAGQCELAYFGLTSALIGTGSGAYLMDRALEIAWARGIERMHLHTCTIDSPQALGFYARSGFTAYRRQVEIADDPRARGLHGPSTAPQIPLI